MIASIAFPDLKACKGIEYLQGLADLAHTITTKFSEQCEVSGFTIAPTEAVQGDIRTAEWSDADIMFTNSALFPDELLEQMAEKLVKLKKGSRVISS